MILCKHIRPFEIQVHGAFVLVFRETDMVPLQIHPGFQGPLVHVFKFVNTDTHMVFNCLGEFNIVGIKNKLHRVEVCPDRTQMTSKSFAASRDKSCQLNEPGIPQAKTRHAPFTSLFFRRFRRGCHLQHDGRREHLISDILLFVGLLAVQRRVLVFSLDC